MDYVKEVERKLKISKSSFGGQGHIVLIYAVCENLKAVKALETGVAYGWSSAAILSSVSKRSGKLISVDMPMIKQVDYHLIGVAVDENLKNYWELLREPDRHGLNKAIKKHNYSFDLAHYDSDKSYYGRKWSYPLIWKYLRKGGVFISDDIDHDVAFKEFVESKNLDFFVLKFEGKYVGVIRKYT
jgi:predicted O-methyltransferase YrrM